MILLTTDSPAELAERPPLLAVQIAPVQDASGAWPEYASPVLDPDWAAETFDWASDGQISHLRIRRNLGLGPGRTGQDRPEHRQPQLGDRVILRQVDTAREWFRGVVRTVSTNVQADPDREDLTVEVAGPELLLAQPAVSGQWHRKRSATLAELAGTLDAEDRAPAQTLRSDLPVVFNQDGKPNASAATWRLSGNADQPGCGVFEPRGRREPPALQAVHWTPVRALRSLVEVFDGYRVISPETDWTSIGQSLAGAELPEVDVESLCLLEAIRAVLDAAGFGFAIEPFASDAAGRSRLLVCPRHAGSPAVRPLLAQGPVPADSRRGQAARVRRITVARDAGRLRNAVTVLGDLQRCEAALEFRPEASLRSLHPAWDTNDPKLSDYYSYTYDCIWPGNFSAGQIETFCRRYHKSGSLWPRYRHALRSFCWNEHAELSGTLGLPVGDPADLSGDLADEGGQSVSRPRPAGPRLQFGDEPSRLATRPAEVELFIIGCPDATVRVPAMVWQQQCGLTLDIDAFFHTGPDGVSRQWCPFASLPEGTYLVDGTDQGRAIRQAGYLDLLHNSLDGLTGLQLGIRLTGTFPADRAVRARAARRAEHPWPFPATHVVREARRFVRYRPLAYAGDQLPLALDRSDQAKALATQLRNRLERLTGTARIDLRRLTRGYRPGDAVAGTDGRVISTTEPADASRAMQIRRIEWDLRPGSTRTTLELA